MCTVTYLANQHGVVLTSNRDEHIGRLPALPPQAWQHGTQTLYYPKDTQAGGTWFVVKPQSAYVLLNGAQEKHTPKPPYLQSRGLVLLDLACGEQLSTTWEALNLRRIEPFTVISWQAGSLWQVQWNGSQKSIAELDSTKPHIWSSSTLYSSHTRIQRASWFHRWLEHKNTDATPDDLLHFHTQTHLEDTINGLLIKRPGGLQTRSVTQCVLQAGAIGIQHIDLTQNQLIQLNIAG